MSVKSSQFSLHVEPRGGPISERQLRTLEFFAGGPLPETYVDFLHYTNGAEPLRRVFEFIGPTGREFGELMAFFASDRGQSSIMSMTHNLACQCRMPCDALAIADDSFGNFLLLSLAPVTAGQIYFWDHERAHSDHTPDQGLADYGDAVSLVAGSIDDLLEMLQDESTVQYD